MGVGRSIFLKGLQESMCPFIGVFKHESIKDIAGNNAVTKMDYPCKNPLIFTTLSLASPYNISVLSL
jgi:hypothetical protein